MPTVCKCRGMSTVTRREGRQKRANSSSPAPGHRPLWRMATTTAAATATETAATETAPHRLLARAEAAVASLVAVHPHEMPPLISAASTFFFILSAYFVVLPLRDEGAISLGLGALPGLFAGSLVLTVLAAPVASLAFSLPSIPKPRALVLIHRFFSLSLVFFVLWFASKPGSPSISQSSEDGSNKPAGWGNHSRLLCLISLQYHPLGQG